MEDFVKQLGMFIRVWWNRARGRMTPTPCLYSYRWVLDLPARAWSGGSPTRILNAFGLASGERVLELGPGTGYYSVEAARRVGVTGQLICLDIQKDMLQSLHRRLHDAGSTSVSLLQGDATWLPLQSGSLDHVFLVTVLGEIPNLPHALREIRRVLKSDGRLSVSEQFPDPDFITLGTLRPQLIEAGFTEERSQGRLVYASTWRVV
jgi:ubiquinone/menaquinone biosynthesis C-methylase UbiE